MDFLSFCDGKNSLIDIAEALNIAIWNLYDVIDTLEKNDLISKVD